MDGVFSTHTNTGLFCVLTIYIQQRLPEVPEYTYMRHNIEMDSLVFQYATVRFYDSMGLYMICKR